MDSRKHIVQSFILRMRLFFHKKPWYQSALERATEWKTVPKIIGIPPMNPTSWKIISKPMETPTSFTRVGQCASITAYNENFHIGFSSKRSNNNPSPKAFPMSQETMHRTRLSVDGERVFREKTSTGDILTRRFVAEEEATRKVRRNQIAVIRRIMVGRKIIGPSPLGKMEMAEREENV